MATSTGRLPALFTTKKMYSTNLLLVYFKPNDLSLLNNYFQQPEFVFSEDYQVALMSEHFRAFDTLRHEGFFMGEFIWNFADFATKQGLLSYLLLHKLTANAQTVFLFESSNLPSFLYSCSYYCYNFAVRIKLAPNVAH